MGMPCTEALRIIKVCGGWRWIKGRPAGDKFFAILVNRKMVKITFYSIDTDDKTLYQAVVPCSIAQSFTGSYTVFRVLSSCSWKQTDPTKILSIRQKLKWERWSSQPTSTFSFPSLYRHMYYTYQRERDLLLKDTYHCFWEIETQLHLTTHLKTLY